MAHNTPARTPQQVIEAAQQMLELARGGERDFLDAGARRLAGLYNAVTYGRSVTFVLQNLSGKAAGFEVWYVGVQDRLRADPVARWFVELRNRIQKQGTHGEHRISVENLVIGGPNSSLPPAPPGTRGTFIGDALGRSGWDVEMPDGRIEIVYFRIPATAGNVSMSLAGATEGRRLEDLLQEWLLCLEAILEDARDRFI